MYLDPNQTLKKTGYGSDLINSPLTFFSKENFNIKVIKIFVLWSIKIARKVPGPFCDTDPDSYPCFSNHMKNVPSFRRNITSEVSSVFSPVSAIISQSSLDAFINDSLGASVGLLIAIVLAELDRLTSLWQLCEAIWTDGWLAILLESRKPSTAKFSVS